MTSMSLKTALACNLQTPLGRWTLERALYDAAVQKSLVKLVIVDPVKDMPRQDQKKVVISVYIDRIEPNDVAISQTKVFFDGRSTSIRLWQIVSCETDLISKHTHHPEPLLDPAASPNKPLKDIASSKKQRADNSGCVDDFIIPTITFSEAQAEPALAKKKMSEALKRPSFVSVETVETSGLKRRHSEGNLRAKSTMSLPLVPCGTNLDSLEPGDLGSMQPL